MNQLDKSYWSVHIPLPQDGRCTSDSSAPAEDVATVAPNDSNIYIEVVNDVSTMLSLEEEWDKLALNSPATVFQTFEWQYQWWKHFANKPEHHLFIVLFKIGGRLVGIAPFFIQSYLLRHYRFFTRLMLLGSGLQKFQSPVLSLEKEGPSDYLDIIIERGLEREVASALVAFIEHDSYIFDEIDLQNVRDDGFIFNYVLPALSQKEFIINKKVSDVCPMIPLPDTQDKFIPSMRPKVRRNLRYVQRNYLANPEFSLVDASVDGNTAGALDILTQLHQRRWNATGYPGLFSDRCFDTFQHDVIKAFSKKGRLAFKILRHKEKTIVAHLGFRFNGKAYSYMSGYDRSDSGAGSAVLLAMIEDSIKSNCRVFDLGRGEESYKFQFTSSIPENWEIIIRPPKSIAKNNFRLFKLYSSFVRLRSRMKCESTIFKIIAGEKGIPLALPGYMSHLARRLYENSKSVLSRLKNKTSATSSIHSNEKEELNDARIS
ncbi:MAG: GNAT family N-acetyltransferase [Candidatus Kryptoniota bacterium]